MSYLARQAILDDHDRLVAYEVLQDGTCTAAALCDADFAAALASLCGSVTACVRCTAETLAAVDAAAIAPQRLAIQIAASTEPTLPVVNALQALRRAGHMIVLDHFAPGLADLLLPYADLLKVEFCAISVPDRREVVARFARRVKLIAAGLDTRAAANDARAAGFHWLQGRFLAEPNCTTGTELPPSRMMQVQLLEACARDPFDFRQVEDIVKRDAALCYRLLRYLNSAAFCLQSGVKSIRHALALLGEKEVRRWVSVSAISGVNENKPEELVRMALVRARLAELLAPRVGCAQYDAFLVGLFSLMNAILDLDFEAIVAKVELPSVVSAALVGKGGRLLQLKDLVAAYEQTDWQQCEAVATHLKLHTADVREAYLEAVIWAGQIAM